MTRLTALLLTLFLLPRTWAADPPAEPLKVSPRPLEELRIPPGTVIVVRDSREGLGKIDAVVLSPEEYRRQLDLIEQLRQQVKGGKPPPPGVCRLSGRVEQRGQSEIVRLRAVFEFAAPAGRSRHFLGFRRAAAAAARMENGELPLLLDSPEGYVVTVEGEGRHILTLDLEIPVQARGTRGSERGVIVNLPGCPITLIEDLELPAGVESVRLRPVVPAPPLALPPPVRILGASDLRGKDRETPALALGSVEGVELTWDVPTPQRPADPVLTADGDIRVQVGETFVQTTATLTLRSLRGRVAVWRLQTPPNAEVTVPGAAEAGITLNASGSERADWVIRAREPGVEALTVEVLSRQTRGGAAVPVGPFNLAGAFRQQGSVRISAPNHLRTRVSQPRNDVGRRELPPDSSVPTEARAEFVQATYGYGQVSAASPGSPLMHVDADPVAGELRTQVTHQLSLTEAGWRLVTEIKATPIRMELELIEVEIPAVLHPSVEVGPRELVEKVERAEAASNKWLIRLAHRRRGETTVRLESLFPRPASPRAAGSRDTVTLTLPRVLQSIDRDGQIQVTVPEGLELRGSVREWDRDRPAEGTRPLEERSGKAALLTLTTNRSPASVELAWGPAGAAPPESTVDVLLEPEQWSVRHRLTLPAAATARQVVLRAAGPPPAQVRIDQGGTLTWRSEGEWLVTVPPSPAQSAEIKLTYSRPAGGTGFRAGSRELPPLLWPAPGESVMWVRVWGRASGLSPRLTGGPWERLAPASVAGEPSLPDLMVFTSGPPAAIALDLIEAASLTPASLVAEKVLVEVVAADAGPHHYLVRFLLRRAAATWIDLELPAAAAALGNLELFVGGRRLTQVVVVEADGTPAPPATGRIIRVPIPAEGPRIELAVRFFLPDRGETGPLGRWRLTLTPPRPRGSVFVGATRWHVVLPGDDFVLPGDDQVTLEQRWGLRGFLPARLPARTAQQLDRWFRADLDEAEDSADEVPRPAGGVIVRQSGLASVRLVPVPRVVWYLVCSMAVLAIGGLLAMLWRWRWLFWPALALLLAAGAAASLLWRQIALSAIAGAPPGALVLVLLLTVMIWQAQRYRRRVVFLPGFSRSRAAVNGTFGGSSQHRHQASTIDAPPSI